MLFTMRVLRLYIVVLCSFVYALVGPFNLTVSVDSMFFIGSHLVALSHSGKLGVWHAVSQNWQVSVEL